MPYVRGEARGAERTSGAPRVPLGVSVGAAGRRRRRRGLRVGLVHRRAAPAIDQLGVSEAFAGLVVVAIAGNAVENVAGLVLARKGQADLAISVVKNSVAQIAAFLYPALVLVSLLFAHQLTFALAPVLHRARCC